jgi:hypothetical protein
MQRIEDVCGRVRVGVLKHDMIPFTRHDFTPFYHTERVCTTGVCLCGTASSVCSKCPRLPTRIRLTLPPRALHFQPSEQALLVETSIHKLICTVKEAM